MKNTEPAFPLNELSQTGNDVVAQHFGITLRDYFATSALQGIVAKQSMPTLMNPQGRSNIADAAYLIADEMMAAR